MQTCLSAIDARHANRHDVEYQVIAQHRRLGEFPLSIGNISASCFLGTHVRSLRRGDRVSMRLPVVGWIEAHLVWASDERAGFQFERLIRIDDFTDLLAALENK
ncbi:PilZ domain-containing protein [Novosphingobium sp. JCM 18896]|uniref:PilZ domain-containing protein n=1 Tax=Novosphingobium sp. JCM 18896 TaxID=2989731 RepID=UPI0022230598|nr:PilZ domain-containing protein [Novosphingobium sp. JCM 18896]MCW1432264.1 PilZ domain-containing protein [Novosphingobium sp. JCM 18896]